MRHKIMSVIRNRFSILMVFIPWIVFSVFYTQHAGWTSLAAIVLALCFNWQGLKKGFILP